MDGTISSLPRFAVLTKMCVQASWIPPADVEVTIQQDVTVLNEKTRDKHNKHNKQQATTNRRQLQQKQHHQQQQQQQRQRHQRQRQQQKQE